MGLYGLTDIPGEFRRGQWYRIRMDGADIVSIELLEAPDFPS